MRRGRDTWTRQTPGWKLRRLCEMLEGMACGEEIILITWLHQARRKVMKVHPQSDKNNPLTGVFATRSPDRPNPLGLHRVKVLEMQGTRLKVGPLEAIDGTPIVDIKPSSRKAAIPEAIAESPSRILFPWNDRAHSSLPSPISSKPSPSPPSSSSTSGAGKTPHFPPGSSFPFGFSRAFSSIATRLRLSAGARTISKPQPARRSSFLVSIAAVVLAGRR